MLSLTNVAGNHQIPVRALVEIRRKALRKKIWFKVLGNLERSIVSLAIRCVQRIRSSMLVEIIMNIAAKLRESERNCTNRLTEVGRVLAQKSYNIAKSWGNTQATDWTSDLNFARYLGIMAINNPRTLRTGLNL